MPLPEAGVTPDSFLARGMLLFARGEPAGRVPALCSGGTCTYSFGGETVGEVSIEDVRGLPVGRRFERALDFDREGVGMGNRRYLDGTLTCETFGGWIRYGGFAVSDVTAGTTIRRSRLSCIRSRLARAAAATAIKR